MTAAEPITITAEPDTEMSCAVIPIRQRIAALPAAPAAEQITALATDWVGAAQSVIITGQDTYDLACELLLANKDLQKAVIAHHEPIKKASWNSHQTNLAAERSMLDPLQQGEKILKPKIGAWDAEQRRLEAERQRKADEVARQKAEEDQLAAAIEAENQGAAPEEVAQILAEPVLVPRVAVAPVFVPKKGVALQTRWHAEVANIKELCRAVADGNASAELVQGNMPALNKLAIALKNTFNVPGCRAVPEENVGAGRR